MKNTSNNITQYYNDRAQEYDKVYHIPEEQPDLQKATAYFQRIFNQKSVLEIACGTGYWTAQISKTAASIHATDINQAVIDIAKTRHFQAPVTFELVDMYRLQEERKFDGIFGGFIWSHLFIQDIDRLLGLLNHLVVPNGDIVLIDSRPVEGTQHDPKRITRVDALGNTFQTRQLDNGSTYEVLKNFPSDGFLRDKLSQVATDIRIIHYSYYWIATGKLGGGHW